MRRLYGLDALRGIAALAVMLGHFTAIYKLGGLPLSSALAVDLFFILSGLVMARTYEERLRDDLTASQFLALRYRRLFLPLAIGSTICFIATAAMFGLSIQLLASWLLILAFLPTFWTPNAFPLNGPAWSLFLEILSNAMHGVLLAKRKTGALIALWAGCAIVFICMYLAGMSRWDYGLDAILLVIPRELSCYLIGIILCRVYGDRPLGTHPAFAILAFTVALWAATLHPLVELICALIVAPLVVRASLSFERASWAAWLGGLSYPLYATHVPAIGLSKQLGAPPLISFAFAAILAIAVTHWFELRRNQEAGATRSNKSIFSTRRLIAPTRG